jgi:sulfate transport system substrate-binding protein
VRALALEIPLEPLCGDRAVSRCVARVEIPLKHLPERLDDQILRGLRCARSPRSPELSVGEARADSLVDAVRAALGTFVLNNHKHDQLCVVYPAMTKTTLAFHGLIGLALTLLLASCGGTGEAGAGGSSKLSLVAYSTPKEAYEEIAPAFAKTPAGSGVTFAQSYGNSGDQARAIIAGLPADVAALSLEPDVTKLVDEKLVPANWNATPTKGIVTRSVVVLALRPGNPKNIKGWADLVKPGVEVLTPNPFTSGGARWNVMAAYGAQIEQGQDEAQASEYLRRLFRNVVVQDKSARESLQNFTGGKGDVLISYENEAITAQQKGAKLDYVIPDETILIENPIAATVTGGAKARAFIAFATSEPAQRIFAAKGYRPVLDALADEKRFPVAPEQFDITRFGGWPAVMKKFFDPKDSVMQRIEESLGVSTG